MYFNLCTKLSSHNLLIVAYIEDMFRKLFGFERPQPVASKPKEVIDDEKVKCVNPEKDVPVKPRAFSMPSIK